MYKDITKYTFSFFVAALFSIQAAQAQELKVATVEVGTAVENRQIAGADTSFTANVGQLYCYTQITGAQDSTEIEHVWYYKDEEKARIQLPVLSKDWRTWSSKKIQPNWTGPWRIMIEDAEGNVLATTTFVIRKGN